MRLVIPSITLGVSLFSQDVSGLRLSSNLDAANSDSTQEYDTSNMSPKEYEEHISRLLKQKVNAKFDLRQRIAGVVTSLLTEEECSPYPKSFKQPDVGVLSCSDPQDVCVKSSKSSLGGFCLNSDIDLEAHGHYVEHERQLLSTQSCTYANGTEGGEKCKGMHACKDLNESFIENYIGCGSCNGYGACWGISGKVRL